MNKINRKQPEILPKVLIGGIGLLKLHQISDDELTRLERGSGHSLFLNLGIGVISIAVAFLVSLLTTQIASDRVFTVFIIITVVGFLSGAAFLIMWWCTRQPISKLVQQIRDRLPPEGEAQQLSPQYSETNEDVPSGTDEPNNND